MDTLKQHEIFEIEVLDRLRSLRILDPLVFGGGTMLRLCHELNRYSVDLDFWFIKEVEEQDFFSTAQKLLEKEYELTDAQLKHYTAVFELRSTLYPKRLKIEIRRGATNLDFQEKIAFSRFSTMQVLLKALTLEQCMENKIAAFLDRGEIRDCFDIEFLLRRGIRLPHLDEGSRERFQKKLSQFRKIDFKVKLGSIIEEDMRRYYLSQGFSYLKERLQII